MFFYAKEASLRLNSARIKPSGENFPWAHVYWLLKLAWLSKDLSKEAIHGDEYCSDSIKIQVSINQFSLTGAADILRTQPNNQTICILD